MTWTDEELMREVDRFERELEAANLLPNSVRSYVDYARRFLRWRVGDYRPRGAVGPERARTRKPVTAKDLRRDVTAYEHDLRAAGRQPAAVHTYVDHAARFIRWLDGNFTTQGPVRARARVSTPASGRMAAGTVRQRSRTPADLTWAWEGAVQESLVSWLVSTGWTIERAANTKSGEHGIDILASRGSARLAVEVKGYPQATYARGERAGQPKRWHPAAQARTYFGTAIHAALIMRDALPGTQIALALPDVPSYRAMIEQVRVSLAELGVRVLLVRADGSISEPNASVLLVPDA